MIKAVFYILAFTFHCIRSQEAALKGDSPQLIESPAKKQSFKASRSFSHAKSDFSEVLSESSEVVSAAGAPVIQLTEVVIDKKTESELQRLKETDKFGNLENAVVIKDQYGNTVSEGNKMKVALDNDNVVSSLRGAKGEVELTPSLVSNVKDLLNSDEMKANYDIITDSDAESADGPKGKPSKRTRPASETGAAVRAKSSDEERPHAKSVIVTHSVDFPAADSALAASPGRYVNVTDLRKEDLVWISTIEGLTAHFDMMKRFWAFATAHRRNLVVASYKSAHYPGVKAVDICAHFNLPENIKCIHARRNVIVNLLNCSLAPEERGAQYRSQ